jgi:4-amino-4-deoxy-L-arabinose transferase-like glycosyltransferase
VDAKRWLLVIAVAAMALGPGLGSSGRLTYHEAIWAQAARELVSHGDWIVPTVDGRPWLEKPPLQIWSIALIGRFTWISETVARTPSAVAAVALILAITQLAARRYGQQVGLLTGLMASTTLWTVVRGRLGEADIILAALIGWTLVAFSSLRDGSTRGRWAFFGLLGATSLVKGIGFGAVLVLATAAVTVLVDHDWRALRFMGFARGWLLATAVALAWPIAVSIRYPDVWQLWAVHVLDRLAGRSRYFAGESWAPYSFSLFWQTLPWTPLAVLGIWRSVRRDALLCAWAVVPAVLVSLASARNSHYLIHALPPWSIWAAQGLTHVGRASWCVSSTSWGRSTWPCWVIGAVALAYAVGFACAGQHFDRRGAEWAFYEHVGRTVPASEPLLLVYGDWDRTPYMTGFGPTPHDLAVRLFYLGRPALWSRGIDSVPDSERFCALGRERDLEVLKAFGRVDVLARGPTSRWDRCYVLVRVQAGSRAASGKSSLAGR